jgi:polysaccharide pyruvyl transferase WcaK-like protein
MARTPILLFGLSENRLRHPWTARAAEWLLQTASAVTFRERLAIENLTASGVRIPDHALLPDPALGAPRAASGTGARLLAKERIPRASGRRLALAPRSLAWMGPEVADRYEREQIALLDLWCREGANDALFVPQCTYSVDGPATDDRHLARRLRAGCRFPERVHVVEGRYDYDEVESLYREADCAVATRLHGAVFAARMGVPVIGLAYEDKVRGFFDQIGIPEACLAWDEPAPEILARLRRLTDASERMPERLLGGVARLQDELHAYVDIAERLIGSTRAAEDAPRRGPTGRTVYPAAAPS